MELSILSPGTDVTILDSIHGKITTVMIEDGMRVSYKVIWVSGTSIVEQWVPEFAVKPPECNRIKVGFGVS